MPIKKIQLRGISRTPSDRITSDGGCSESINVNVEGNETGPAFLPKDVTSRYDITEPRCEFYFIHKGANYEYLIYLDESTGYLCASAPAPSEPISLFQLQADEQINEVSAVGNTLIVLTNQRTVYVLRTGATNTPYQFLGSQIPIPAIEFKSTMIGIDKISGMTGKTSKILIDSFTPVQTSTVAMGPYGSQMGTVVSGTSSRPDYDVLKAWDSAAWSSYLSGDLAGDDYDASYAEINTAVWDIIQKQIVFLKRKGYLSSPVFVRYAVGLYDGTYIYQSVPILIGGGSHQFMGAYGIRYNYEGSSYRSLLYAKVAYACKAIAYLRSFDYEGWEDIVKTVEIFLSTDIHYPLFNSKILGVTYDSSGSTSDVDKYDLSFAQGEQAIENERILNEVLSKTNFYRVASFELGELSRLENGYDLLSNFDYQEQGYDEVDGEFFSQDFLVTQPTLPDDYQSFHKKLASSAFIFNNSAIISGVEQEIYSGYPFMNGTSVFKYETKPSVAEVKPLYELIFLLKEPSSERLKVRTRNVAESTGIETYSITYTVPSTGTDETRHAFPFGWIAYPDPRCYGVYVRRMALGDTVYVEKSKRYYPMSAHPGLNCAYAFIGFENAFGINEGSAVTAQWSTLAVDNRVYWEKNILWMSEINNPFVFPASGKLTFRDNVVGVGSITKPISPGQAGGFDLYVFTGGGIYYTKLFRDGTPAQIHLLSNDVALSGSVSMIDQAIVFTTASTVKMLTGNDIADLSPYMKGAPYSPTNELMDLLDGGEYAELAETMADSGTFISFMTGAKCVYDYKGRRLIFFKNGTPYQYIYRIDSNSWHKIMSLDSDGSYVYFPILSRPDCLVCCKKEYYEDDTPVSSAALYDYETRLDDDYFTTGDDVKGLIVTRPFDLDEPDIRKTIRSVRIRGEYNRDNVKYALLGSFDGIHWKLLRSLRGGSYKQFRMAIVCDLSPTERISWVDIDYESRFTNRLR